MREYLSPGTKSNFTKKKIEELCYIPAALWKKMLWVCYNPLNYDEVCPGNFIIVPRGVILGNSGFFPRRLFWVELLFISDSD